MNILFQISDEVYTTFKASLVLTGQKENAVVEQLLKEYAQKAFQKVVEKQSSTHTSQVIQSDAAPRVSVNPVQQRQEFVKWFQTQSVNGSPYKATTIHHYTDRVEQLCRWIPVPNLPSNNLFSVSDVVEFRNICNQIMQTKEYKSLDDKTHGGFRAALRKYDQFLSIQSGESMPFRSTVMKNTDSFGYHKWTFEENEICCREFLKTYVMNQSKMGIEAFLNILAPQVPEISRNSLRAKIQNIRQLCIEAGISDTAAIKPLTSYSSTNKSAFYKALAELEIHK